MSLSIPKLLFSPIIRRNLNVSTGNIIVKHLATNKIITSNYPDIEIPNISIPEFMKSQWTPFENYIAYECGITGRKITYNNLRKKSENLGKSLRKCLNLKEGDVVAIILPNVPEYAIAALGILEGGLVITTLNPIWTPEEISRQLEDSSTKAIITLPAVLNTLKKVENLLQKKIPTIAIKTQVNESLPSGIINFQEFTDNSIDYPNIKLRKPTDIALLPYSSGTTGLPKGVQLTHHNIVSNILQVHSPGFGILDKCNENHQHVIPAVLPMFHIFGLRTFTFFVLCKGCKMITLPKFTPELYIDLLRNYNSDVLYVVPPIVLFLTSHPAVKSEYLQRVQTVMSGGAPLGALDEEKFLQKAGKSIDILQGYGLTETSPAISITPIESKRKDQSYLGSIGTPIPNTQVKILDITTGKLVGPNTPGEILVKGPQVMKCYHNKSKETEEAFNDGWFRTGDIAYYNEKRIFFITDRLKELIKVKGYQVPPAELEEIIRHYPNISDAAVIGVPHSRYGEVPRAYIVLKDHGNVDLEKLKKFVENKVAEYKGLRGGIEIVDNIPKSPSGKILRRQLKLRYDSEQKLRAVI